MFRIDINVGNTEWREVGTVDIPEFLTPPDREARLGDFIYFPAPSIWGILNVEMRITRIH